MKKRRKNQSRSQRQNNFGFEKLEPKNLLAGISFDAVSGVVTVEGSNAADAVRVQTVAADQIQVSFAGVESQVFDINEVSEVVFFARSGNDWFRNDTAVSSRAYGHGGDDILIGGSSNDRLRGGPGADRLMGQNGNDYLGGDGGDDLLLGGNQHDRIDGFWGNDRIWGESGNDNIIAGAGDDYVDGGDGNDKIFGYNGDDVLKGGKGADEIRGHAGNDWISGNNGSDDLYGDSGRDRIFGSFGDDDIFGGDGGDDLRGQNGNDRIYGGQGNDDLYGGRHADHLQGGDGNDDYYDDRFDDVRDDSSDHSANGDFELRGNVTNLNTTTRTFTLLGINVSYSNAEYSPANLQNGSFVKAEGAYDGTTLQAHEVENEVDDDRNENIEARGVISNLDTTAKTFQLLGFNVNYSNARVEGQLANGTQISLEGLLNGTNISATEIESGTGDDGGGDDGGGGDNQTDGDIELRGLVTNLNSTSRTFNLLGLTVSYSNAQLMGQFGNGSFVKVDGRYNGTQINAREVELEVDDNRDENFEARGVISNLDTGAQRFDFLGFTVNYDGARVEAQLVNGASVDIEGSFANFVVDADRIR